VPRAVAVTTAVVLALLATALLSAGARADTWAWGQPVAIDNTALAGVACPSATLCLAIDAQGRVVRSRDPSAGPTAWAGQATDPDEPLVAIACPSTSLCVAIDGSGGAFISADPAAASATWTRTVIDAGQRPTAIACPSTTLCVVSDGDQSVITSVDPAGGAAAWSRAAVDPGVDISCSRYNVSCGLSLTGVACPSTHLCVAVDDEGNALISRNPIGGAAAWTVTNIDPEAASAYGLTALSCPKVSLCVSADGYDGDALSATQPSGGSGAWTITPVGFEPAFITCPLSTLCVGNDGDTPNFTSTDPAGPGSTWHSTAAADSGAAIDSISCPTVFRCVAVDTDGRVVSSVDDVPPLPAPGARPTIDGSLRVGARLTAHTGTWQGPAAVRFTYRWQRCATACRSIAGAHGRTLTISPAERGARLRLLVTGSERYGHTQRASTETKRITG
jgi:hypothetical protein